MSDLLLIILCRFSDFQVNEIGKDGVVVHLRKVGLNGQNKLVSCHGPIV